MALSNSTSYSLGVFVAKLSYFQMIINSFLWKKLWGQQLHDENAVKRAVPGNIPIQPWKGGES